jgi:8-oxo-dGTP pyrophosphatase MutT (NUDIX family)
MRAAATVLLLREFEGELEVLMMRRGAGLAFMADMWVFPGGRIDAADASAAARARVSPEALASCCGQLHSLQGERLADEDAIALHVAACRETFEEAGVLLARDRTGRPCSPDRVAALQPLRGEIERDASRFIALLEAEHLYVNIGPLVYWSHWITPSIEPKRYDTRFFAIPVPPDQSVSADLSELTEHAWVKPALAHAAIERGEIRVVAPTLLTLEDLAESYARHGALEAMLGAERGRPTPPVMPRIEVRADEIRVVMPWDPSYANMPGEGCTPSAEFPPHLLRRDSCVKMARNRAARQKSEGPGHDVPGPRDPAA